MASALQSQKITFIGGGNMAAAIISGLASKRFPLHQITVAEPWEVNRKKMAEMGVQTTSDNAEAAIGADIIILAVKPQVAKLACQQVAASAFASSSLPLLVSIAAGITCASLSEWSTTGDGRRPTVVRVMPNTPALVGEGASGMYAASEVQDEQKQQAEALLQTVSRTVEWVDREELLDVVTGLSGSGPAYFFAMVEHLVASATKLGLSEDQAMRLASQTCYGAGKMLVTAAEAPSQLRKNVTSPNGTTQAALDSFDASAFADTVDRAVQAAAKRGEELGRSLAIQ